MKPAPGNYRLNGPPPSTSLVTVTDTGMVTTFGTFAYDPVGDLFALATTPPVFIRCTGEGTFIATYGAENYTGTCVRL